MDLDYDRDADHPAFEAALHGRTVVADFEMETGAQSFVLLPVRVGRGIFGTLSLGATSSYGYGPLELRGFDMIANSVGVSIANFRSSRMASRRVAEYTETAAALTAVAVARQVAHEANMHIDNCQGSLAMLLGTVENAAEVEPRVDTISQQLWKIRGALERLRIGTSPSTSVPEQVTVGTLWAQAVTVVAHELDRRRVERLIRGKPDVAIEVVPDQLRSVFLHLLMNSIHAFDSTGRQPRRIRLIVDVPSQPAGIVVMRYEDNAGGVDPQQLRRPAGSEEMPLERLLFEEGTTSKRGGSGLGLWLVRRFLDEHCGSIELLEYRKRIVFRISIPKQACERLAHRSRIMTPEPS